MTASITVEQAARVLHRGGVIAYPTEAVWGLGCDPFDEAAVMRLLALKRRPVEKGVILIAASLDQFDGLLDWEALPTDRAETVFASWPGPRTWIVPASARDVAGLVPGLRFTGYVDTVSGVPGTPHLVSMHRIGAAGPR